MDLVRAHAHEIAAAVTRGEVSAVAVTEAFLQRIRALDTRYRSITDLTAARALTEAAAIDEARRKGKALGPLAGVPFLAKNLFDIQGVVTRAGSKINRENAPAQRDAAAIRRLTRAGATLLGATNMGEYAYDFTGRNAHDGNVANPHDPARLAGGSSSGSAAAVAAGFAPVSLGSDTNGSVRVPASLCGLFGLKPTFGRISRAGSFPFVASLDHVGVFARDVMDLALVYEAIAGPHAADPVCADKPVAPVSTGLARGVDGLRVAVAGGYFREKLAPEAIDAVERAARALGAQREVLFPEAHRARAAAFLITMAEGGQLHLERLRQRASEFDPETRDRLIAGNLLPSAWVLAAQRFRRWYRAEVAKLFEGVDVVIAPATPVSAPLIEQTTMEIAGEKLWVRGQLGLLTQPISFIGLPAVAAPVARPGTLPIGVQLIAAPWREDLALRAAAALAASGVSESRVAEA